MVSRVLSGGREVSQAEDICHCVCEGDRVFRLHHCGFNRVQMHSMVTLLLFQDSSMRKQSSPLSKP